VQVGGHYDRGSTALTDNVRATLAAGAAPILRQHS